MKCFKSFFKVSKSIFETQLTITLNCFKKGINRCDLHFYVASRIYSRNTKYYAYIFYIVNYVKVNTFYLIISNINTCK